MSKRLYGIAGLVIALSAMTGAFAAPPTRGQIMAERLQRQRDSQRDSQRDKQRDDQRSGANANPRFSRNGRGDTTVLNGSAPSNDPGAGLGGLQNGGSNRGAPRSGVFMPNGNTSQSGVFTPGGQTYGQTVAPRSGLDMSRPGAGERPDPFGRRNAGNPFPSSGDNVIRSDNSGGLNDILRPRGRRDVPSRTYDDPVFPAQTTPESPSTSLEETLRGASGDNGAVIRSNRNGNTVHAGRDGSNPRQTRTPNVIHAGPNGERGGNVFGDILRPLNNDDDVTIAGRVLGTSRPVDEYGRTRAGQALNTNPLPYPTYSASGDRRSGRSGVYVYNWRNGDYERYHGRSGNGGWYVDVLAGTLASRPTHRFRHGAATVNLFYYPYYVPNTVDYAYATFPSPYYYYNYGPSYIPSTRVIVVEKPVYIDSSRDEIGDDDSYYLNRATQQDVSDTLEDLRKAWTLGDSDLLLRHVRSEDDIPVYLKGKYLYSLPPDDYRDLTADAMKNTTTIEFRWLNLDRRSDDQVYAKALHTFKDSDGQRRVVFATFTLVRIHGAWWIGDVGSSSANND